MAERRYQAVAPAPRLGAATLEQRWEEALRHARQLQEAYARCRQDTPPPVQAEAWARSTTIASAIPALGQAPGTPDRDRQAILRGLVDRVIVHVQRDSAYGQVTLHWAGGSRSQHEVMRPVRPYAQRHDFETLMHRMRAWRTGGATTAQRATTLHREGFVPPKRSRPFSQALLGPLRERQG